MDVEHAVLCTIIGEGDLTTPIDLRISDEFFTDDRHRKVWQLLRDHWAEYGTVAGVDVVSKAYPMWVWKQYPEPLRYYLDQLRDTRLHQSIMEGLTAAFEDLEQGGADLGSRLLGRIRQTLAEAVQEVPAGKDIDHFASFEETMVPWLEERRKNPGHLRGLPTGFESIDHATGGYQPGQFITFTAVPKVGKSSLLIRSALEVRTFGAPVLFFTFEMSADEQRERLVSLLSGVALTNIQNGFISDDEMENIIREHKLRSLFEGFTIVADPSSVTTVSAIQAKIRHYRPRAVFIDGMYFMDDEKGERPGSPQALTNITRSLKRTAQLENVPIIGSTQALISKSKGGVDMGSVGYSSSFVQDSDAVFGADKLLEDDKYGTITKFKVLAIRAGRRVDTYIRTHWDTGSIEEITAAEAELRISLGPGQQPTSTPGGGNNAPSVGKRSK